MDPLTFHPPAALRLESSNLEQEWTFWEQKFDLFLTASGFVDKPESTQIAAFLHSVGDDALKVYNSFSLTADERKQLSVIRQKFKEYCTPRKNVVYERFQFSRLSQSIGESIDAFVTTLRLKAKSCAYGDQTESIIRDRVVIGCVDHRVQERLLREPDLSLEKAIQIVRAAETTKEQVKSLRHEAPPLSNQTVDVLKVKSGNCGNCGTKHQPKMCPAFAKRCNSCGRKNHYAKCCQHSQGGATSTATGSSRSRACTPHRYNTTRNRSYSRDRLKNESAYTSKSTSPNTQVDSIRQETVFFGSLETDQNLKCWIKSFYVNGVVIRMKLDTGAESNCMSKTVFETLKYQPPIRRTNSILSGYGGNRIAPIGTVTLKLHHKRRTHDVEFFVVDGNVQTLLGLASCQQLDVVRRVDALNSSVSISMDTDAIITQFADVFTGVGRMPGEHKIVIDKSVTPVVHAARRVPLSLQPRLKIALDRLLHDGIIVKQDEPTDWVNSLLIVEKSNGQLRLVLDPKDLNKAIKREHYFLRTVEDIVSTLHGKRVFTVIDMSQAFHAIVLNKESTKLCTFNSIFGRFSFNRLPYGICSAPEVFQKRVSEIFADIQGVQVIFDDLIIAADDVTEHDRILRVVLERARKFNVRFNRQKLQLRVGQVRYMGHIISVDGLKADPDKVKAITEMPVPTDRKSLLRFLGMITYLSKFIQNCATLTHKLRQLTKSNVVWQWGPEHQVDFDKIKQAISQAPTLRFFDPNNSEVTIQCDSSSMGLGSCLMQNGQPVSFASRALSDAETRYPMIDKELLAIVYSCSKFHSWIYGLQSVRVQSDHRPLEAIFKKPIASTSPRLQRLLLKVMKYPLRVEYTRGSEMYIADTLSRAYLPLSEMDIDKELSDDVDVMIHTILHDFPASNKRLEQFRHETEQDVDLSKLKEYLANGFSTSKSFLSPELKQLQKISQDISILDGLYFVHNKIIVPKSMRQEMLSIVHEGHLGIEKCKMLARQSMYWPGMNRDVENVVAKCAVCNAHRNQQAGEPLLPHAVPQRPWTKLGADIFTFMRKDYLLVVDYYSKYIEMALLEDKTASCIIVHLKSIFARFGIPLELIADNMPFGSKAMKKFADSWNFTITNSSPNFAQSNGQSERGIQTVKKLLQKAVDDNTDPYIALLQYRSAPVSGMTYSPAQLLFNRTLRTKLPEPLITELSKNEAQRSELLVRQAKQKHYYDAGKHSLPCLQPGDVVRIRNHGQWQSGQVLYKHFSPRSYVVQTEHGTKLRRNRRHLIKTRESTPICSPPFDEEGEKGEDVSSSAVRPAAAAADSSAPGVESSDSSESRTVMLSSQPPEPPRGILKQSSSMPCTTRSGRAVKPPVRFKDFV